MDQGTKERGKRRQARWMRKWGSKTKDRSRCMHRENLIMNRIYRGEDCRWLTPTVLIPVVVIYNNVSHLNLKKLGYDYFESPKHIGTMVTSLFVPTKKLCHKWSSGAIQ